MHFGVWLAVSVCCRFSWRLMLSNREKGSTVVGFCQQVLIIDQWTASGMIDWFGAISQ
jgi:hypothetical protein